MTDPTTDDAIIEAVARKICSGYDALPFQATYLERKANSNAVWHDRCEVLDHATEVIATYLDASAASSRIKELEAALSTAEADRKALMEVARAGLAMRIFTASGKDAFRSALSALPAHIKEEASK